MALLREHDHRNPCNCLTTQKNPDISNVFKVDLGPAR